MKHFFYVTLCLVLSLNVQAKKLNVLFIGNSYTDVNNLPEIVKQIAASMNDTLVYSKSTPGGYTFNQHSTNAATLGLIAQGGWDYVVLQEQSQYPSFPIGQVQDEVFPFAKKLDSLVHIASPCAKTVFYMTWGRKNGDPDNCPGWPPVCTYEGMDSLLQLRYTMMAQMNNAWLSPVAKVWRHLREMTTSIELYQADNSHPSEAGSYAAALSFYAVLFGKDASMSNYNFNVNANDAAVIRNVVKMIVYDSLATWRQYNTAALAASYTYTNVNNTFTFTNNSMGSQISSYKWNFGDGTPEVTTQNATHTFMAAGTYQVCLSVKNPCGEDTHCKSVTSGTVGIDELNNVKGISVYPNPAKDFIQIKNLTASYDYSIYNTIGQRLKSGRVGAGINTIDVNEFSKGVYYLEMKNEKAGYVVLKWMK
ncbi:PKD domain-containing protein [Taibaiella lutea]|nr:PKD domain-containing protein [Taibaiella lutea]